MKRAKGVDVFHPVSPVRLALCSVYVALCEGAGSSRTLGYCSLATGGGGITAVAGSKICLSTLLPEKLQASPAGNPLVGPAG